MDTSQPQRPSQAAIASATSPGGRKSLALLRVGKPPQDVGVHRQGEGLADDLLVDHVAVERGQFADRQRPVVEDGPDLKRLARVRVQPRGLNVNRDVGQRRLRVGQPRFGEPVGKVALPAARALGRAPGIGGVQLP